jgi:hypothetical protein
MMKRNVLSKLNLTERPARGSGDPVAHRRNKLLTRLQEQRAFACADIAGEAFEVYKDHWVEDPTTGTKTKSRVLKRVKRWFFEFNGNHFLEVRYGNRPIEFAKGKSAILVGDREQVPVVIDTVIEALNAGELDQLLMAIPKPGKKKVAS